MPTTQKGASYTIINKQMPSGQDAYIGVPSGGSTCFVLYTHGANGGSNQFSDSAGPWPQELRDWLIDHGIGWIEGLGGGYQPWGNPASESAYNELISYADSTYTVQKWIVLGRSMGGIVASRIYTTKRATDSRFVGLIVNSGVQDLIWAYDSGSWTAAMNTAWGVTDRTGFISAIAGKNPIDGPSTKWSNANVLQMWGTNDTLVVPASNGQAMRSMYSGKPFIDRVDIRSGGDHSANNGSYLQVSAMTDFISTIVPERASIMAQGIIQPLKGMSGSKNVLPLRATTVIDLFEGAEAPLSVASDGLINRSWVSLGSADGDYRRTGSGSARAYAQPGSSTTYFEGFQIPRRALDYEYQSILTAKGSISGTQAGSGIFIHYIDDRNHLRFVDGGAGVGWRLQQVVDGVISVLDTTAQNSVVGDIVKLRVIADSVRMIVTTASGTTVYKDVVISSILYGKITAADEASTPIYCGIRTARQGTNTSSSYGESRWTRII